MIRRLRPALAAAALLGAGALVASSCGSGLETLRLSRTGRDASKLAAGALENADAMWWGGVEYVVDGTLPSLGEEARAWNVSAPSVASSKKRFSSLARHLGVEGELVANANEKSTWSIGLDPDTWTGMTMYASDSETWWSYYSGDMGRVVSSDCVSPDGTKEDCIDFVEPPKPANLPSPSTAEKGMLALLEAGGENPANYEVVVNHDDWGVYVQAIRRVDGMDTSFMWWMSYGADAKVTSANGTFVVLDSNGSYPLVDPNKAVERLTTWMYTGIATDLVGGARVSGGSEAGAPVVDGAGSSGSDGTAVSPPATGTGTVPGTPIDEPLPPDSIPAPEPVVVTITDVRLGLMAAYLEGGEVMLLPSYIYSNDSGDVGSVYAISDEYLGYGPVTDDTVTDSTDTPAPPTPTVPPLIEDSAAHALVGLSEQEAMKSAESNGWIVRVGERDGEKFALTDDYVTNRVTLTIADGTVTDVAVG